MSKLNEASLADLRKVLQGYEENGHSAKSGDWEIATGGYDLNWQLYYKGDPVVDCIENSVTGSGGTIEHVNMDREDFLKVSKVIKEEYPDVLTKAEEKAELTGLDYKTLWEELGDVPVDENENIDVDWRQFPKGTFREDIWHWFEEEYGISVGELMNGDEAVKEELPLEEKENDKEYVFSATKEGLEKISSYISEMEAKRKEILDAGLDTVEEVGALPTAGDIINDIQFAYEEETKDYCHHWDVTDNHITKEPLLLELNKDFVKTKILEVERKGQEPDADAWVTIQQGNRKGYLITTVGELDRRKHQMEKLEDRYGPRAFAASATDEACAKDLIALGEILDVPNLRELPLIDDQSHALQTVFRMSRQNDDGGCVYIDKNNYQELLGDIFRDGIDPNASLESVVLDLHSDVCHVPGIELAIKFPEPEVLEAEEGAYVTVYPEFPACFASRDKSLRQMIYIVEDSLMEIASPDSSKEAGCKTLEEAMERRGLDKIDFMELMQNAAKSKEVRCEIPIGGAVKINTQKERVDAVYTFRKWMKKPGKKIAKEIEAMKAKGKGVGK